MPLFAFTSQNSHSMNANFDQLSHITTVQHHATSKEYQFRRMQQLIIKKGLWSCKTLNTKTNKNT